MSFSTSTPLSATPGGPHVPAGRHLVSLDALATESETARRRANLQVVSGVALMVGGLAVGVVSQLLASRTGGSYLVPFGLVGVGAQRCIGSRTERRRARLLTTVRPTATVDPTTGEAVPEGYVLRSALDGALREAERVADAQADRGFPAWVWVAVAALIGLTLYATTL